MYVISCGLITRDHKPRGGRCFNQDGNPETDQNKWAIFTTMDEANEFAKKHNILVGPGTSEVLLYDSAREPSQTG